jgi:hypothetical protein
MRPFTENWLFDGHEFDDFFESGIAPTDDEELMDLLDAAELAAEPLPVHMGDIAHLATGRSKLTPTKRMRSDMRARFTTRAAVHSGFCILVLEAVDKTTGATSMASFVRADMLKGHEFIERVCTRDNVETMIALAEAHHQCDSHLPSKSYAVRVHALDSTQLAAVVNQAAESTPNKYPRVFVPKGRFESYELVPIPWSAWREGENAVRKHLIEAKGNLMLAAAWEAEGIVVKGGKVSITNLDASKLDWFGEILQTFEGDFLAFMDLGE